MDEIKLADSNGEYDDGAGYAVAISGTTAVVGTDKHKTLVFVRRGDIREQLQTLPVGGGDDETGHTYGVAIDGGTIVVVLGGKAKPV